MHKYLMLVLLIVASGLGLAYSFFAAMEAESQKVEPPEENELRFVATNFAFDKDVYEVEQGETLVLSMRNELGRHGIEIEGLDINLIEGETVEYTFDEPGEYRVICSIPCGEGHDEMISTLIVQ